MNRVKIQEIANQVRGVSYKPIDLHDSLDDSSVILLRANNIDNGKINFDDIVYVDKSKVSRDQYLKKGDILVCASSGSKQLVGKAASVDFDQECTFGAFCKVVRPQEQFAGYLGKYFQSNSYRSKISAVALGANINNIRNEHIDSLDLNVYDEEKNKNIVQVISCVQSIIEFRKQELQKLDELIKARFVELFSRFIECAEPVDFESVCEFVTVGIANSATHAFCDKGVIMFRNQNIKEDYLDATDIVHITPEFANKYKTKKLQKDDLLIVRTGYPGVACLVPKRYEGCQTFTTLIARLKNNAAMNPRFVCHYINSEYGKKYVKDNSAGAAQQNFGATALSKLPIYIPPIEKQDEYIRFVEQVDKSKVAVQKALDEAQLLFDSLMQKYFG